jgi:uncharacterized membrane protein YdjX (TVP38/TMEM64 family)
MAPEPGLTHLSGNQYLITTLSGSLPSAFRFSVISSSFLSKSVLAQTHLEKDVS